MPLLAVPIFRRGWGNLNLIMEAAMALFFRRANAMQASRETIIKNDALGTLENARTSKLNASDAGYFYLGQFMSVWNPKLKRWETGYRLLSDIGRCRILEIGNKPIKIARRGVRSTPQLNKDFPPATEESQGNRDISPPPVLIETCNECRLGRRYTNDWAVGRQ